MAAVSPLSGVEFLLLSRLAMLTAGARAGLVLRRLDNRVYVDPDQAEGRIYFDTRTLMVDRLVYGRLRSPFDLIHEFGHAYHAYYWPVATTIPRDGRDAHSKAEAAAYFFELELSRRMERGIPQAMVKEFPLLRNLNSTWGMRRRHLNNLNLEWPEPFDILAEKGHTEGALFHDVVGSIIGG